MTDTRATIIRGARIADSARGEAADILILGDTIAEIGAQLAVGRDNTIFAVGTDRVLRRAAALHDEQDGP